MNASGRLNTARAIIAPIAEPNAQTQSEDSAGREPIRVQAAELQVTTMRGVYLLIESEH